MGAPEHTTWLTAEPDAAGVLVLSGELDIVTAPLLETLLGEAPARGERRVVDLGAVSFADSYGLVPLVRRREELVLRGERPLVRRVLDLLAEPDRR